MDDLNSATISQRSEPEMEGAQDAMDIWVKLQRRRRHTRCNTRNGRKGWIARWSGKGQLRGGNLVYIHGRPTATYQLYLGSRNNASSARYDSRRMPEVSPSINAVLMNMVLIVPWPPQKQVDRCGNAEMVYGEHHTLQVRHLGGPGAKTDYLFRRSTTFTLGHAVGNLSNS